MFYNIKLSFVDKRNKIENNEKLIEEAINYFNSYSGQKNKAFIKSYKILNNNIFIELYSEKELKYPGKSLKKLSSYIIDKNVFHLSSGNQLFFSTIIDKNEIVDDFYKILDEKIKNGEGIKIIKYIIDKIS